jgi:predicted KAP-like P-loop ATPase
MWSDNETDTDLLDFKHLVAAVTSIINNKGLHPATLGIYGDWGSGKSSLMQMVRSTIENRVDTKIMAIQFNGWLFESYDDAKSALMGTILDEMAGKRKLGPKAKELLVKLIHKVDWMRVGLGIGKYFGAHAVAGDLGLVMAAATDIPAAAQAIASRVKDINKDEVEKLIKEDGGGQANVRMAIRDFHEDFKNLLKESGIETLVVFIDDLDRCNPGTVIDIFEAIRLFLFVPNSVFVIAADEDLIRYAVSTKFPGFQERSGIGRDYLEKLIQYPVKVPALGKSEIENYIKLLFVNSPDVNKEQFEQIRSTALERALSSFQVQCLDYECIKGVMQDVSQEIIDGFTLAESLAPILAVGLSGNPRQTKRFLNTLKMRIEMAKARGVELNLRKLAKLMLLEYFQTEPFKKLAELQASQEGKPRILEILEKERELSGFKHDGAKPSEGEKAPVKGDGRQKLKTKEEVPEDPRPSETSSLDKDESSLLDAWRADEWMKSWLNLEPALSGTDLRPYFYFSRDNLAFTSTAVRRMSPAAQKIIAELLGNVEIIRRRAIDNSVSLNPADANSIFSSLADRFRNTDDATVKESVLKLMFDFVDKRKDILSQMILFLKGIPETMIPLVAVTRLEAVAAGREEEKTADALLREWASNKLNLSLARAATTRLQRKTRQK